MRERAHGMLALGDGLPNFHVDLGRLDDAAELVIDTTRAAYPTLDMPFHSRWRHFVHRRLRSLGRARPGDGLAVGRGARPRGIRSGDRQRAARCRRGAELALSAIRASGEAIGRSEGLALASLAMFRDCAFSMRPSRPLRADASILAGLPAAKLARGFQVIGRQSAAGLAGRADLLRRLGRTVMAAPEVFGRNDTPRPGGLFDHLAALAQNGADRRAGHPVGGAQRISGRSGRRG